MQRDDGGQGERRREGREVLYKTEKKKVEKVQDKKRGKDSGNEKIEKHENAKRLKGQDELTGIEKKPFDNDMIQHMEDMELRVELDEKSKCNEKTKSKDKKRGERRWKRKD